MYKKVVEKIDSIQESRLTEISVMSNRLCYPDGPGTKKDGLYWIYTTYSNEEFLESVPSPKRASIDFRDMVKRHDGLSNTCKKSVDGFRLVYNGVGGIGDKGHGGLRERILGEFRGGEGTGSLAIRDSSLTQLCRWRVSFVLWSEIDFETSHEYRKFGEALETLWRIHFGWPILCRK